MEVSSGGAPELAPRFEDGPTTTDQQLDRFDREYMAVHSLTIERRLDQVRLLRRFDEALPASLVEMTQADVLRFLGTELAVGLHPNTVRKHLGMIRAFITWAHGASLIDSPRAAELKSVANPRGSSTRTTPRPYKLREIRQLRALLVEKYPALPTHGRGSRLLKRYLGGQSPALRRELWRHARRLQFEAQIALALEEGLRRKEILGLTIPEFHYDNETIVVRTAKQGPGEIRVRELPFTSHARQCVQEWLDFRRLLHPDHESPWLALAYQGGADGQLAPLTLLQMREALPKAFGSGWSWHRLRHTCATEWLRNGVPLEKVRIYMGHASLDQTLMYAQIVHSDVESAFAEAERGFASGLGLDNDDATLAA